MEAIESISSMKIIDGAFSRAVWNRAFIIFSESPTNFEVISEDVMLKKFAFTMEAQASPSMVLPVPGGPYRRIPKF